MSTSRLTIAATVLLGLLPAWTARAQFGNTGGGGNSGFGGSSSGFGGSSSGFGGSSSGFGGSSSGFGSSSGSSGSGSTGTFGSRTLGSGAGAGKGSTGGTNGQMNNLANVGQLTGSERFIQSNRKGQFVGGGAQNANSLANTFAGGMANQNFSLANLTGGGRNNRNNNFNTQQQQGGPQAKIGTLRTTLKTDFEYPALQGAAFNTVLSGHLESSLRERATGPLVATVRGRTVVLQGAVATEHDRVLAERLALLEPGVAAVQNELVVQPKSASTDLPAPK